MKKILSAMLLLSLLLLGCAPGQQSENRLGTLQKTGSMELHYATQFSVDYYEGGYKLLTVAEGGRFLVIPQGKELPRGIDDSITPLYQPIENIYLAATASMCLFDALERLDAIRLSGTAAEGWYIENARKAMEEGKILFAGKYSEPDYELLLANHCSLAIESTMINHSSDVAEKLRELGIPVLIDHSSFEVHPLGRTEWMKAYAALLNEEEKAEQLFSRQLAYLEEVTGKEPTGKTAAFFYITSSGKAVCRKSGDYVTTMMELAGGRYVFDDLGDPNSSAATTTIEMETFFSGAKDADYIIYNATIGGKVDSIAQLLEKSALLSEFKAVQNGNVWCTDQNMYQETTQLGQMIHSFRMIFSGEADELDKLPYLYRLK